MAGNLLSKEYPLVTITSTGASLTTGSAVLAGTLDCRSGSANGIADTFAALFSLTAQWATAPAGAGQLIADLYLVPAIDGSLFPDVDLTAGSSYIAFQMNAGSFTASKAPTAATLALFSSGVVDLMPTLYNVYILNRSGQTMSANWSLKALAVAAQYT
jgi:hypothetical protein